MKTQGRKPEDEGRGLGMEARGWGWRPGEEEGLGMKAGDEGLGMEAWGGRRSGDEGRG